MLTILQEKLAEAHGLGIVATEVASRIANLTGELAGGRELETMREESEETRARCLRAEEHLPPELADEMRAHTATAHEKGVDLIGAWFKAGTDRLRAWTFLAMVEAAEVAAWIVVEALAARTDDSEISDLARWALPVQRRHLATAFESLAALTSGLDPVDPRRD